METETRPRWSDRRRKLLVWLAVGAVAGGVGIALPEQYGVTAAFLGALCAFLLVAAVVVFLVVPGPGTLGTLLRSVPLAGATLVVAVLLLLSTAPGLHWLWLLTAGAAALWTGFAVWQTRQDGS